VSKQRARARAERAALAAERAAAAQAARADEVARRQRRAKRDLAWRRARLWRHGPGFRRHKETWAALATLVLVAVLSAWARFGRATFPARYLVMIPLYVAWKIPLYLSFAFRGPYATWERAERSASGF